MINLYNNNCLDKLQELEENTIDTIITDPPYGISFLGENWDHGIPGKLFWERCLRVAKPGATLLAFGGTRTHHRLMVAIEDAGWEIRDVIMWVYGEGFPKSLNISKAIDKVIPRLHDFAPFAKHYKDQRKKKGLTHAQICEAGKFYANHNHGGSSVNWENGYNVPTPEQWEILQPLLDLSESFLDLINRVEAERISIGTQVVPKVIYNLGRQENEQIEVEVTVSDTDTSRIWEGYGTGLKPAWEPIIVAMKPVDQNFANNALKHGVAGYNIDEARISGDSTERASGRWPANLIHDGSNDVLELFPHTSSGKDAIRRIPARDSYMGGDTGAFAPGAVQTTYGDVGSAARFFYCAKAKRKEREAGLDNFQPHKKGSNFGNDGARPHTPEDYVYETTVKNTHPTVKPIELMRYLARLTKTPTGGIVLDPFMGSGSTGIGAVLEGRDFVGIELSKEYYEIAKSRIEYWSKKETQLKLL